MVDFDVRHREDYLMKFRMFMRPRVFALALASLVSVPVLAADAARLGEVGTAAYEAGMNSGLSPQTVGEETTCAVYWNQWYEAIDLYLVSDALLIALPEAVDSAATFDSSEAWADRATNSHQQQYGNVDAMIEQANREIPEVADLIDRAVQGDEDSMRQFMEMLGICQI